MNFVKPLKRAVGRVLALAALIFLAPVSGQQRDPRLPDQDSPELYLSFFFFHEDFAKWTAARMAADPSHRGRILQSSAKYLGISASEFAALEKLTGRTAAGVRALTEEARVFVEASKKANGKVDRGALVAFDNRRKAIVQAGVDEMKKALSRQSWQGLHSYINNQHRQHITISPRATAVKPPGKTGQTRLLPR